MPKDSLTIALQFLKFRPRTVFEIEKKLKEKKVELSEIEKTIDVLKKNKLLDDKEFAKMYVRDRNLLKPTGSYLLRLELKRLGVGEKDIEDAVKDQDDEKLAQKALAKFNRRLNRPAATELRLRESKGRYRDADFQKQAAFLQRRGFSTSVIYKILKK